MLKIQCFQGIIRFRIDFSNKKLCINIPEDEYRVDVKLKELPSEYVYQSERGILGLEPHWIQMEDVLKRPDDFKKLREVLESDDFSLKKEYNAIKNRFELIQIVFDSTRQSDLIDLL